MASSPIRLQGRLPRISVQRDTDDDALCLFSPTCNTPGHKLSRDDLQVFARFKYCQSRSSGAWGASCLRAEQASRPRLPPQPQPFELTQRCV